MQSSASSELFGMGHCVLRSHQRSYPSGPVDKGVWASVTAMTGIPCALTGHVAQQRPFEHVRQAYVFDPCMALHSLLFPALLPHDYPAGDILTLLESEREARRLR